MTSKTITQNYATQYQNPIAFKQGEKVQLQHRDTDWPDFIWGIDVQGRSGWVHDSFVDRYSGEVIALRDYDARELSVQVGEVVRVIETLGGWHWCENTNGVRGWIPDAAIQSTQTEPQS